MRRACLLIVIGMLFALPATAAFVANYDEDKVPEYTLPDLLTMEDGTAVKDAKTWTEKRRPELFAMFEEHMYGKAPGRPEKMQFVTVSEADDALGGKATRKEVDVLFNGRKNGPKMRVLFYLPNAVREPAPLFLTLNFRGNHTIHSDPAISLGTSWSRDKKTGEASENKATDETRGSSAARWPVERIIERGYGLATIFYGDIAPDDSGLFNKGVRSLYQKEGEERAGNAWGAIGTWAWGLSRAMDYIETDRDIDAKRVALMGHSRLGKTSLWAGASDERFAIVISNDSGCGGAALTRRAFGETHLRMNTSFPHWLNINSRKYNEKENDLPVDQHGLLALIAPRTVVVACAEDDRWADTRGQFLSAFHAGPVYRLLGKKGLGTDELPGLNEPIGDAIRFHVRPGKHNVMPYDWERYLDTADDLWGKAK